MNPNKQKEVEIDVEELAELDHWALLEDQEWQWYKEREAEDERKYWSQFK